MDHTAVAADRYRLTVALAGNPNSGKTSIFNELTGANQHVGNWPGVTVEHKEGYRPVEGGRARIIDLPGTYSLTANSPDERIARDFVLHGDSDVVIAVVDASNLERNLYLVVQLIELGARIVMALNMCDIAQGRGFIIDVDKLSTLLDLPVVPTCANVGEGIEELWATTLRHARNGVPPRPLRYGRQVDEAIDRVVAAIREVPELVEEHPERWLAICLLIGDESHLPASKEADPRIQNILRVARMEARHLATVASDTAESAIINGRYGAIQGIYRETVFEPEGSHESPSDRIDRLLLHRLWGVPILLLAMAMVFEVTFFMGAYPSRWIEAGCVALGKYMATLIPEGPQQSLVVDGIIGGLGSVLVFIPQIFILFACIAFLEDSGYMARAAFLMDRFMHRMSLHGKAFIPMLMGFGCNVPAIMATRTLESARDRLVTILVAPLMTCSARLPIYAVIAGAMFGRQAGLVIFSIYLLGIVLAALLARLFRRHVVRGEDEPFVLELPPYHRPTLKGIVLHTWERGKLFLQKAGTVILAGSVIMWFLSAFPWGVEVAGPDSYAGQAGKLLEPLVKPLGFAWQEAVALISGFAAKEIVVSTLGVLYGIGSEPGTVELGEALRQGHLTPLSGYGFMAFVLIYSPCLATIGAIRRETASWRWTLFAGGYLTALAWVVAFIIYQGGRLVGIE
ncbi:MAG: ferrous iron transport protein B [Candidatus Zipacnadales bacterium]